MAWTTPRTWTDGELVTKSIMDTHIRDNLDTVWHLIARKTADQSVTSSTAVQDDDHLLATVGASEVWALQYRLRVSAHTSANLDMRWTFPTGGEIEFSVNSYAAGALYGVEYATTSPSAELFAGVITTSEIEPIIVNGFYVGGGNAGTVTLQWAQNASNATSTTLKANSVLMGMKLA